MSFDIPAGRRKKFAAECSDWIRRRIRYSRAERFRLQSLISIRSGRRLVAQHQRQFDRSQLKGDRRASTALCRKSGSSRSRLAARFCESWNRRARFGNPTHAGPWGYSFRWLEITILDLAFASVPQTASAISMLFVGAGLKCERQGKPHPHQNMSATLCPRDNHSL